MQCDMSWCVHFIPLLGGTATYQHLDIEQAETLYIDACLTGVGGVWKDQLYAGEIPLYMRNADQLNITHFEMINILVSLP